MDNLLRGTEHLPDEAPTSGGKLVPPVISTTSPAGPPAVRIQPKPPFAFGRTGCSLSAEIAVRTAPNSPFAFDRSAHTDSIYLDVTAGDRSSAKTAEAAEGVYRHVDGDGILVAIEVLDLGRRG